MIAVLYIPRSGSRFISSKIADDISYKWLGEIFNSRTYPDKNTQEEIIKTLYDSPDVVFKMAPWNMTSDRLKLLNLAEKVYVSWRKDFNQQLQSFYCAIQPNVNNYHAAIEECHIQYNETKYQENFKWLSNQYISLKNILYKLDRSKIVMVDYESFATPELRYRRNFIWSAIPPVINFNTEKVLAEFL